MTDHTTTIATFVGTLSAITTALFGFDYYSLLFGLIGALLAASQSEPRERWRAITAVAFSTLVGAAFGTAAIAVLALMFPTGNVKPILFFACLMGGFGGAVVVSRVLDAALSKIKALGGTS